ncbi:SDR family oxidoreductase [Xanthobacter sp. VTT E-85241]|uniref:SDR family NAD(P)-dependent oxidoreductase n=1 Tax=Roseixanthobacter finlandensis TaxID=3119922 RepID=UPI00372A790D
MPESSSRFRLQALFDLTGHTALVTGGNSGIGLALARALGLAGASVVLVARRPAGLAAADHQLQDQGIASQWISGDLATAEGPDAIAAELVRRGCAPDILVNAAGLNLRQPFMDVTLDAFDLHMAVHVRAPFRLVQLLAPEMAARSWGRIVNIASLQSFRAFPNSAPYGAAKGAIAQLTRAMAEEWSPKGITCNAIAPGFFPTPLTQAVFDDDVRAARNAAQTAIGRNGALEDLHGAVVFLASDASAYVTGQVLAVDGGFTAK